MAHRARSENQDSNGGSTPLGKGAPSTFELERDPAHAERLAARAADGDARAFSELVEQLWPWLLAFVGHNRSMGPRARDEDHVHDVAYRVIAKIAADGRRRLALYPAWSAAKPGREILDWFRVIAKNVIRDYVREQLGVGRAGDAPSATRLLNDFAGRDGGSEPGERPAFTAIQTARELLAFAKAHLSPPQLTALRLWLDGATFGEIGSELGTSPASAHRLYQASVAILRSRFSDSPRRKRESTRRDTSR